MNQQHQTEERNTNFKTTNDEDDGDGDGDGDRVEDQICSLPQLPIQVAITGINLGAAGGGGGENGAEKGMIQSGNERTAPNEEQ